VLGEEVKFDAGLRDRFRGLFVDLPCAAVGEVVECERRRARRSVVMRPALGAVDPALCAGGAEVGLGGRFFGGDDDIARVAHAAHLSA